MSEALMNDEASRRELDRLQGSWRTIAVEVDGAPVASWLFANSRLVIAGDRFTLRNPLPDADQSLEGVLTLDPGKVPRELKLILDGGQTFEEIYELAENTLRVCYPLEGGSRPTDFTTTPQSGLSLVVYERESQP